VIFVEHAARLAVHEKQRFAASPSADEDALAVAALG
jgi:hypothetical protein